MTEDGMVARVWRSIFLGAQPRPYLKAAGPQRVQTLWDPLYVRTNGLTYSDESSYDNTK